jgi:hypothetical protein
MTETFWDFIGWYGTIAILGAFGFALFNVFPWGGNVFMILNLSGAIALVISGILRRTWHTVVFYLIWGIMVALKYFTIV